MKIALTGHTRGIGKEIYQYFENENFNCLGFSRSNGFDISNSEKRKQIAELSKDCDIFVNNAYCNFDDSQLEMLKEMTNIFHNQKKIIINVSTRATIFNYENQQLNLYKESKKKLDQFCEKQIRNPWIINLKPGLVDTSRVEKLTGNKMSTSSIVSVIDFVLKNQQLYKTSSITFGL